jgi:RNA-directed DNA polymerase
MFGLPVITDLRSLSDRTGLSRRLLYKLSVVGDRFYHRFEKPKKSGGSRTIMNPSQEMKAAQAWILRNLLERVELHPAATGFRKGHNIADNATPHAHNRYFLSLDIEDFFPSIRYGKVYSTFKSLGYNSHVAHILAKLCTCDGKLPQGGVSSPALANIVCMKLDRRISGFVGRRNVAYTRYADDLTFSGMVPNRLMSIKPTIQHIVEDEGFRLNSAKTRLKGPRQQCKVTGLVLSDGHVGLERKQKRNLRAAIHCLVLGRPSPKGLTWSQVQVRGWLAFVKSVDKTGLRQLESHAETLAARHSLPNPLSV